MPEIQKQTAMWRAWRQWRQLTHADKQLAGVSALAKTHVGAQTGDTNAQLCCRGALLHAPKQHRTCSISTFAQDAAV